VALKAAISFGIGVSVRDGKVVFFHRWVLLKATESNNY
jgi:hypothetical protein